MAKEFKNNPDFPKFGAMVLKKDQDEFEKDAYYIKIDEDTVVTVNGKRVTSLNMQRPIEKYHRMLKAGKITPEQFEDKDQLYSPEGEKNYIKFEIGADLREKK